MLHIEDNTEDYGQRIFGFIHPPRNDSCLFGIATDDSSELWLSSSEDPRDKQRIARAFKCYYDENDIFSIEAILRHKQVACMRKKMFFTIFKYLFLFQRYSSF